MIFNRKNPAEIAPVPSTSNVGFKSRDLIEGRIMDALKDPSVYSIGIWGIGGVGKTVMAKKIEEKVRDEKYLFQRVVTVVVSQQPDLPKLQRQIAEGLNLTLSEVSPVLRQREIHERLMAEKSILIILDDLWERLDLEEFGIPSQTTHAGCKLILTSRYQHALTSTCVPVQNIFQLEILTKEESWRFFRDNADINLDDDDSQNELLQIAHKVERECKGLPLALKTVAFALKGKDISLWKNAVHELQKSVPDNIPDVIEHVYKPLLYSINALEGKEQKDLFVLCCLFPEDYSISIDELLRCGVGLRIFKGSENLTVVRYEVETLLNILLSRSLLTEHIGLWGDLYVRMHDVIRDVGIWIAREGMVLSNKEKHIFMISHGEKGWPVTEEDSHSNYTCISLLFSHHNISFPESIDCPKLEFLRLDLVRSSYREPYIKLPENFFNGMGGLKVLEASYMKVLPPSVGHLNDLRTLYLQNCKTFETATVLGKLVNLEMLTFRHCEFEVLPMEIGGLKKLKIMNILDCQSLRVAFGVVSGLVGLEELVMLRSFDNWEAEAGGENHNACFSELNGLKNLTTLKIEIRNPSVVPRQKPLWVQTVKKYCMTLSNCGNYYSTKRFKKAILLGKEVVNPLGGWIYDMVRNAEFLYLEGSNCMTVMKELSQYSGDRSCLKELNLRNFTDIRYLAEGQQNGAIFPMLESLDICNSDSLQQISGVSLPTGSFVVLRSISLDTLSGLMCLWKFSIQGQLHLGKLDKLSISSCSKLAYLFSLSIAQSLVQLSDLNVYNCQTMKEIFKKEDGELVEINDIKLPKLSSISLQNLNSFCCLCNGIDSIQLPELRRLYLHNLPSIKMMEGDNNEVHQQYLIPKAAGINFNFFGLQALKVKGIGNLKCMFPPSVISGAPNLRELEVEFCSMLEHVIGKDDKNIEEMILFPNLYTLRLSNLPNILTFCYNDIQLPSLEALHINQCPMMLKFVELPEHTSNARPFINKQVQCPNLKALILEKLSITRMFSSLSFKSLTNLEYLYISDCKELEYMIMEEIQTFEREFIQMVSLKEFSLRKLPKLFGYVFQVKHPLEFPLLEEINIEDCPLLKKFACESLHLPKLKRVSGLLNIEVAANFFFHKEMSFLKIQSENNCFILSIKDVSFSYNNSIYKNGLRTLVTDSSEIFVNAVSFAMGAKIVGNFKAKKIHTGTDYEIILMIMLDTNKSGEYEIELKLPGGSKLQCTENLENQPREIWTEISLGKFVIREPQHISENLEFSLRPEFSWMDSNKRLYIKGVRIVEV